MRCHYKKKANKIKSKKKLFLNQKQTEFEVNKLGTLTWTLSTLDIYFQNVLFILKFLII